MFETLVIQFRLTLAAKLQRIKKFYNCFLQCRGYHSTISNLQGRDEKIVFLSTKKYFRDKDSLAKNIKTKKKQEKLWVIEVEQGAYVLTQKYIYKLE